MIAQQVWKEMARHTPLDNAIDVHMVRLRRKIDDGFSPKLLHTVRGVGFVLRVEPVMKWLRPKNVRVRLTLWYVRFLARILLIYSVSASIFVFLAVAFRSGSTRRRRSWKPLKGF
jgi:hypothetical protein